MGVTVLVDGSGPRWGGRGWTALRQLDDRGLGREVALRRERTLGTREVVDAGREVLTLIFLLALSPRARAVGGGGVGGVWSMVGLRRRSLLAGWVLPNRNLVEGVSGSE
jgi:hypothetical protein